MTITPPELHGLLAIAREEGLDMKPVLLRVLTDLYIATPAHSLDEEAQFREIAGTLAGQVDVDTAMVVACKLATYPHTPAAVGDALLNRGDDASRILLADARWLPAATLVSFAAVGERVMAAAVAARAHLDADLVRLLLDRRDPLIDVTLAANTALRLPADILETLLGRARDEEAIAAALLSRGDLSGADRSVLFLAADKNGRRDIIVEAERLASLQPRRRAAASDDSISALETAAMANDGAAFAQVMALALGVAPQKIRTLLADRSGEVLTLALVALRLPEDVLARILMLRDPLVGHSTERFHALIELSRRVSPAAAERIVSAMLGAASPQPRAAVAASHRAEGAERPRQTAAQPAGLAQTSPGLRRTV